MPKKQKVKRKKEKKNVEQLSCVQCGNDMIVLNQKVFSFETYFDADRLYINSCLCNNPICANYGLIAIPQELMPKEVK